MSTLDVNDIGPTPLTTARGEVYVYNKFIQLRLIMMALLDMSGLKLAWVIICWYVQSRKRAT